MTDEAIPNVTDSPYTQRLRGYFGELGIGAIGVRFFQTAVPITDLDKLKLVSDLPDSERWPVRQLFQRDVDSERVEKDLMPYFRDLHKIKFFNPLTIAVIPMDPQGQVVRCVDENQSSDTTYAQGQVAEIREAEGFYKLTVLPTRPAFSSIEWNPDRVKLVAVDGQHRLSALKRLAAEHRRDPADEKLVSVNFAGWSIPVVLLVFPPMDDSGTALILENMRDIFVTINTSAKPPSRARTILLNDESIHSVCCQEFLDHCHDASGSSRVPLLFFDWRPHRDGEHPENKAAFMRIDELADLHIRHMFGKDHDQSPGKLTETHRDALFVEEMTPPLDEGDPRTSIDRIRSRYRKIILPAVERLLADFEPIAEYVNYLVNLPRTCTTDVKKHALSEVMFGTHEVQPLLEKQILAEVGNITEGCEQAKRRLKGLFRKLIGPRGLFSGLSLAMRSYNEALETIASWEVVTEWYVDRMNEAAKLGFFNDNSEHLVHICFDGSTGNIINHRHEDQEGALGAYCAMLACGLDSRKEKFGEEALYWVDEKLESRVLKSCKRVVRPPLRAKFPKIDTKELNKKVKAAAQGLADKHFARLRAVLELDD